MRATIYPLSRPRAVGALPRPRGHRPPEGLPSSRAADKPRGIARRCSRTWLLVERDYATLNTTTAATWSLPLIADPSACPTLLGKCRYIEIRMTPGFGRVRLAGGDPAGGAGHRPRAVHDCRAGAPAPWGSVQPYRSPGKMPGPEPKADCFGDVTPVPTSTGQSSRLAYRSVRAKSYDAQPCAHHRTARLRRGRVDQAMQSRRHLWLPTPGPRVKTSGLRAMDAALAWHPAVSTSRSEMFGWDVPAVARASTHTEAKPASTCRGTPPEALYEETTSPSTPAPGESTDPSRRGYRAAAPDFTRVPARLFWRSKPPSSPPRAWRRGYGPLAMQRTTVRSLLLIGRSVDVRNAGSPS
jgi:hypothetical protein